MAATYAGALCVIVVLWASKAGMIPSWGWWLAFPAGIVAALGFAGICMTATRATWWRTSLDERDAGVRDHAYRRGYWIVVLAVAAGISYAMLAADRSGCWLPRTTDAWGAVMIGFLALVGSLPTAVVAWIEPDADDGFLDH